MLLAELGKQKIRPANALQLIAYYLRRPLRIIRSYQKGNLRFDLTAGITVAIIVLPQSIAFAFIAELPPQMGIYTAIIAAVVGGLWGSSEQMFTGPTNAISLLVASVLIGTAITPGTNEYILAAGLMALMVGVFQFLMGVARLGFLVNFVSHSVVVGFSSGAGILIGIKQLPPLLGLDVAGNNVLSIFLEVIRRIPESHPATAVIGIAVMIFVVVVQRLNPRLPAAILSMILASAAVFTLRLDQQGVAVIGELVRGFPPLADLPVFNLDLIARLSTGALAVGAISLVQTTAITRSIATQTGQRLDSNQEFVGQGLANVAAGFFSGYSCAGSFSVTAVNFKAGARSPLAAVFASIFVLISLFVLAPAAAYLPVTALAGVLILTAYGMIDQEEIARIWRGTRGDAVIMVTTLVGTLFLPIEFAVLLGILLSFALYITRTSTPRVLAVVPDATFRHFTEDSDRPQCPQLGILEIQGDLYFGAVTHIEDAILDHAEKHPEQRFLLLRMGHVNHCDFSGIHMLENVIRIYRDRGGDVFMVGVGPSVQRLMENTDFAQHLGRDHFPSEDEVISKIFHHILDPAICIYECPVRTFKECQNLPKRIDIVDIPTHTVIPEGHVITLSPQELWDKLHAVSANGDEANPPMIIDVREPREFRQGHIPEAELIPLPKLLGEDVTFPSDRQLIFVCRGGRRSERAAYALQQRGCSNVATLRGGMVAWESSSLLEAVEA